ncbi:MAG: Glu/Leu/Phe/Val dehydrogenase dimerization domain-containing protein [Candidatus Hodarchaeota archaeon]
MIDNYTNSLSVEIDIKDDSSAYIVIDSTINNTSSGGVRIMEDISIDEVKALAREMTLKYSFMGLPRGGAKCGIKIPSGISIEEKRKILELFGRKIAPIIGRGVYYPGMDMNCGPEELRAIYRGAGITLGKITDTSFFTAVSVANVIHVCGETYQLKGQPITVAIEGFGSVGSYLVKRLSEDDFRIAGVSTIKGAVAKKEGFCVETLLKYRKAFGDNFVNKIPDARVIDKQDLLTSNVDVLVPSARAWAINMNNAEDIKAHFIVPIANAPYSDKSKGALHERGVVCMPGFVCNSGGVYASSLFDNGVSMRVIERVSSVDFRRAVRALLQKSQDLNLSPVDVATQIALQRFKNKKKEDNKTTIIEKAMEKAFRKGIFPKPIYGRLKLGQFKADLLDLTKQIESFR